MPECLVFHCPNAGTETFMTPGTPGRTAPVCSEHHELMSAGADWRWDPDGILMGEELRALGEYVVESMNVSRGVGIDSVSPDGFLTLQLRLRRRGTTDLEERIVLLSVADAATWATGFKISAGW